MITGAGFFCISFYIKSFPQQELVSDANTAIPTVSGFIQKDEIQECEFELVVSDGELTSLPDTVKVIIVPDFGADTLEQDNLPFDPNKPTLIYFGGGDCVTGHSGNRWGRSAWKSRANVINFPNGYSPDPDGGLRTYYRYGDMIIVYLSSVAPDYKQPIQTMGFSTGADPAMDVGIHLNRVYRDARYAVNRVTNIDGGCRVTVDWDFYSEFIELFLTSAVDGEQCWIDNYQGSRTHYAIRDVLAVSLGLEHGPVLRWYQNSLTGNDMNSFNNGVVAGAYWSVIGPGKNLQLAPQTDAFYFRWDGNEQSGVMSFFLQSQYPGRLPEPVTLVGPVDVGDPNGAILTCEESENAVGYQLLFGPDPYRVMDYNIISDTPTPPNEIITTLPFEETWWTVKVYDQYGSTIYADPMYIDAFILSLPIVPIENLTTGKIYGYIQNAINDAADGDEIVASPGIYHENIDFKGKALTLRSANPDEPGVVSATVIHGSSRVVTFSGGEDANCVLAGFTITSGTTGIYCSGASAVIVNCRIATNEGPGIELHKSSNPRITNCVVAGNSSAGIEMFVHNTGRFIYYNHPTITNCTIVGNSQQGIFEGKPTITNSIIYDNGSESNNVQIESNFATVTYSDVQGGFAGEGNIDAEPLFADPNNDDYHLKSQVGRWDPNSQSWVQDDVTSPCIDAGDPNSEWTVELWPHGKRINMGAFGGTPQASMSLSTVGNIADFNADDAVNGQDLLMLADMWLAEDVLLAEDTSRDGVVNLPDLAILAEQWLWHQ